MDKKKTEIKRIVQKFKKELKRFDIKVEEVFIFGSYAKDVEREGSDIDLIIISSDLFTYTLRQRLEILGIAAAHILEPIQAIGFTPEEIEKHAYSPFISEILKNEAMLI